MSQSEKQQQRSANAVSGKTARACDSCIRRRARWYCAADDAFLCQACDSSVHSANPLARRHDRIQLKASPLSSPPSDLYSSLPTWHQGFKRKARTPRHAKPSMAVSKLVPLVPDLEALTADENNNINIDDEVDEEEQLLYRVPIFDPVLAEFCSPTAFDDPNPPVLEAAKSLMNQLLPDNYQMQPLAGFNPSDMELAEFAADVENLLSQGLHHDDYCIHGLGLMEAREVDDRNQVKMELDATIEMAGANSHNNANFYCSSPAGPGEEFEEHKVEIVGDKDKAMMVGLRLNYDAVIAAWSCRGGSPWTDGERLQFNPDDCWADFTGMWGVIGGEVQGMYGEVGRLGGHVGNEDGGREARVSRYREKRRMRLFSKKIRYEVRKLNAEKRPRMKGRFVKRALFPSSTGPAAFPYV